MRWGLWVAYRSVPHVHGTWRAVAPLIVSSVSRERPEWAPTGSREPGRTQRADHLVPGIFNGPDPLGGDQLHQSDALLI